MPSLPDPVKKGANVAASVLETTAGLLRGVAGGGGDSQRQRQQPQAKEPTATEPTAKEPAAQTAPSQPQPTPSSRGTKPPAATRTRISNPKAARKVRAREG